MLRLALVQMFVGADKLFNLKRASDLVARAVSEHSARLVCLPECFNSPYGTSYFDTYAESINDGPTYQAMSEVAKNHRIWLVAGSIPERGTDGKLYNCSVTFDPTGRLVGTYRKLHLFDIDIPGQFSFKESNNLSAGKELFTFEVPVNSHANSRVVRVGIGICYDVRFPELSLIYAHQMGCQLLLFPGAFSTKTGPAHWELLARARALDTQCYVGVCSPACDLEADYVSHAESMITSPWGNVVKKAGKGEEIIATDIDFDELKRVRESIPIGRQRRLDVYSLPKPVTRSSQN
ncbi:Omega-amidase NIT2-A [Fasciola hepatica]|uniref:omega-amidase n=1 Tax=Fasciola hepatica TaxID=6192 RepID=A0A4E0R8A6_FASHE|nr:Omega-amidase NIT2-A [Fasciola hepatica]